MTIEAVSGHKKFRQDPENSCMVQVQDKHGGRWTDYAPRDTPKEAKELAWKLASDPWLHTGHSTNEVTVTAKAKRRKK